jgi:hypothetical protein
MLIKYAHVGMQGRTGDGGVFLHSAFYNALTSGVLNVPPPSVLPDDAILPTTYLIKPYAGEVPKKRKKSVFNYRLSRARRVVV